MARTLVIEAQLFARLDPDAVDGQLVQEAIYAFADYDGAGGYFDHVTHHWRNIGADYWANDPDDVADWRYQVANGDTLQGFHDWLTHEQEAGNR